MAILDVIRALEEWFSTDPGPPNPGSFLRVRIQKSSHSEAIASGAKAFTNGRVSPAIISSGDYRPQCGRSACTALRPLILG